MFISVFLSTLQRSLAYFQDVILNQALDWFGLMHVYRYIESLTSSLRIFKSSSLIYSKK